MKDLLVKRHIACTNGDDLWEKTSFSTRIISELRRSKKMKKIIFDSRITMDCLRECLATLSVY